MGCPGGGGGPGCPGAPGCTPIWFCSGLRINDTVSSCKLLI